MMNARRTKGREARAGMGLPLAALAALTACQAYPTLKDLPLDCSVENAYAFHYIDLYETVGEADLWSGGDTFSNQDGGLNKAVEVIPGERCGSTASLVLHATRTNEWGAVFGFSNFGPRDESAYEGMSFWGRAPGNTGKAFTIALDDDNTVFHEGGLCKVYESADGTTGGNTGTTTDPSGNVISGTASRAPNPDECGNGYSTVVLLTEDWRFYTIPFSQFHQAANPNRVPNAIFTKTGGIPGTGILPGALRNLILRMPKESRIELWIDNLGFYRRAGAGADGGPAGTEAGSDAASAQ